ncbi:MAG: zinc-binding metallopeptidase, partial [Flavobacterium sp.]
SESIFDTTEKPKTELDKWIDAKYTKTYNIAATYLWDEAMGKPDKTLFPPKVSSVKPALQVIKKIWIDSYTEVGGVDFVKKIAPRQLHLVGSYNLNHNGTIVLGDAGGGARITLYNTDYVDYKDLKSVKEFVHTIQHEYIHILNQTTPYDLNAWNSIAVENGGYTGAWYNETEAASNKLGFVTPYARSNYDEDFAETASFVLLRSDKELKDFISKLQEPGKSVITRKIAIVEKYFKDQFNMDFYALRDAADRNTTSVVAGNVEE